MESLKDLMLMEMSRRNTDLVADLVRARPALFDDLFRLFLSDEDPVNRRAAWVVDTVSEDRPEWIEDRLGEIVDRLHTFRHDGLKRHSLRILARSPLPDENRLGELIRICFDWLVSPDEAIAAKVYAMDLLYRISEIEPDLRQELADSIEWRLGEESPGFRNHGQKVLKKLYRDMNSGSLPA